MKPFKPDIDPANAEPLPDPPLGNTEFFAAVTQANHGLLDPQVADPLKADPRSGLERLFDAAAGLNDPRNETPDFVERVADFARIPDETLDPARLLRGKDASEEPGQLRVPRGRQVQPGAPLGRAKEDAPIISPDELPAPPGRLLREKSPPQPAALRVTRGRFPGVSPDLMEEERLARLHRSFQDKIKAMEADGGQAAEKSSGSTIPPQKSR